MNDKLTNQVIKQTGNKQHTSNIQQQQQHTWKQSLLDPDEEKDSTNKKPRFTKKWTNLQSD